MIKYSHLCYSASVHTANLTDKKTEIYWLKLLQTHLINLHNTRVRLSESDLTPVDFHVNATKLARIIPNNYCYYMGLLIDHDFLEQTGNHEMGIKSKSYAFKPKFNLEDLLIEKNDRFDRGPINEHLKFLIEYFDFNHLKINCQLAYAETHGMDLGENARISNNMSLKRFENGDFGPFIEDKNGRFHTNLTNMPRYLRKHITYKGEPLKGIDFPNAQPLFLGMMIKEIKEGNKQQLIHMLCNSLNAEDHRGLLMNKEQAEEVTEQIIGAVKNSPGQVEKYLELVQQSRFYQSLFDSIPLQGKTINGYPKKNYSELDQNKKDSFKKAVCSWINGPVQVRVPIRRIIKDQIKDDFYPIFRLVNGLKSNGHKNAARILQEMESDLVIKGICRDYHQNFNSPLFTIHDCIYTVESKLDNLRSFADKFIRDSYNINVNWKLE